MGEYNQALRLAQSFVGCSVHYVLEVGGGLGDVLAQLYSRNIYNIFNNLGPQDTAEVWLVCHNPFADELFSKHPKASQITLNSVGYWSPEEDQVMRKRLGMRPAGTVQALPSQRGPVEFPISAEEQALLDALGNDYVVLSATAGTGDRRMYQEELDRVVQDFLRLQPATKVVLVGRNYMRPPYDRREIVPHVEDPRIVNLIDSLTVQGTVNAIRKSRGVMTAHTSTCLLSWLEHRATLLLYPAAAWKNHVRNGKADQWMFGINYSTTTHAAFGEYTEDLMHRFVGNLNAR